MSGTRGDARKRLENDPFRASPHDRGKFARQFPVEAEALRLTEAAETCKAAGYRVVKISEAWNHGRTPTGAPYFVVEEEL